MLVRDGQRVVSGIRGASVARARCTRCAGSVEADEMIATASNAGRIATAMRGRFGMAGDDPETGGFTIGKNCRNVRSSGAHATLRMRLRFDPLPPIIGA